MWHLMSSVWALLCPACPCDLEKSCDLHRPFPRKEVRGKLGQLSRPFGSIVKEALGRFALHRWDVLEADEVHVSVFTSFSVQQPEHDSSAPLTWLCPHCWARGKEIMCASPLQLLAQGTAAGAHSTPLLLSVLPAGKSKVTVLAHQCLVRACSVVHGQPLSGYVLTWHRARTKQALWDS